MSEFKNCDHWKAQILLSGGRGEAYKKAISSGIIKDYNVIYHRKAKSVDVCYNSDLSHEEVINWLKQNKG